MNIEIGRLYKVTRRDISSKAYSAPSWKCSTIGDLPLGNMTTKVVWIPQDTWILVVGAEPVNRKLTNRCVWGLYKDTMIVMHDKYLDVTSEKP